MTPEQYSYLSEKDKDKKLFVINRKKLRKVANNEDFIADEFDKANLLKAINFIKKSSKALPENVSFLERLLFCKQIFPAAFFPKMD